MPHTYSFYAKRKPQKSDGSLCAHDDIVEKMAMRLFMTTDLTIKTDFNILVSGLINALKTFEHTSAQNLVFTEYADKDMSKKKRLCQTIVKALKDVKCPHQLEAHQFVYLDYDALAPVYRWVLQQTLLAECRDIATKKEYSNFFTQLFKNSEESIAAFWEAYSGVVDYPTQFRTFEEHVFNKKLSGEHILAEYLVDHYMQLGNSDGSEYEGLPPFASREEKVNHLIEQDGKTASLKQHRDLAAKLIEKLNYDELIHPAEIKMEMEVRAYFATKVELHYIEEHLRCAEERSKYDPTIIPKLLRYMDKLMVRLRAFQETVLGDCKTTDEVVEQLVPKLEQAGSEQVGVTKRLLDKYAVYSKSLRMLASNSHALILQLAAASADTLNVAEREAKIDATPEVPPLGKEHLLPVNETITKDILDNGRRFNYCANAVAIPDPANNTRADLYHKFINEYISDVRFKIVDMYWKAQVLHQNRTETKAQLEDARKKMNVCQKQEIKDAMSIDIVAKVGETILEVEQKLEELFESSHEIRDLMIARTEAAITVPAEE